MNQQTAVIRRGRKFDQVLNSARELFMAHGFETIGVDEIARKAGVSKATLYKYFPDKRMLFLEVARQECDRQAETLEAAVDFEQPVAEVLGVVGRGLMEIILSEFGWNMFRVCVAEGERFPELGREFYETGPKIFTERMTAFLEMAQARGEVKIEDMELAADQFPELCKAGVFLRLVTGVQTEFSSEEIGRVVDGAVEMFMARYGAK